MNILFTTLLTGDMVRFLSTARNTEEKDVFQGCAPDHGQHFLSYRTWPFSSVPPSFGRPTVSRKSITLLTEKQSAARSIILLGCM